MSKILFLRREGVYLPEISAYMNYLRDKYPSVQAYDSGQLGVGYSEDDFDVVWKFMGFDRAAHSQFIVHEYGSLSVGKFPRAKNFLKRMFNATPSLRIFLNEDVRAEMGFADDTKYCLRDMGVSAHFFRAEPPSNPEFDFVYSGSLNRGKVIFSMLDHFKAQMKHAKLLVVGAVPDDIHDVFGSSQNIIFTGRLKYDDVPSAITRARYGLNIMPDIYPFNIQTSTKVLEYCAARMPVISTRYKWIQDFEKTSHANFFYLTNSFENLNMNNIENYQFSVPSMEQYEWNKIIETSKLFETLPF